MYEQKLGCRPGITSSIVSFEVSANTTKTYNAKYSPCLISVYKFRGTNITLTKSVDALLIP